MTNVEKASGYINFDERSHRANYTIHIYRSALTMSLAKIGTYSTHTGLRMLEEFLFRDNSVTHMNRNRKRIVVSIVDAPFFMLKPNVEGKNLTGNDRYEGYCVDLTEKLSQIVNFTYELRIVKDGKFGAKDSNGNWDGMVGELVRHEADLVVSGLTILLSRERAVEFSMPFMNLGISIMVYKREAEVIN